MTTYGGVELGYAEITSNATDATGTLTDVATLSVTADVGARPVMVKFDTSALVNNSASGGVQVAILRGTTTLKRGYVTNIDVAGVGAAVHVEARDAPAAGSYTYKVQMARTAAGTATIVAASDNPTFLQVIEA